MATTTQMPSLATKDNGEQVQLAETGTNNAIVISDLHAGCKMSLCPPGPITLDEGGSYGPSALQLKLWAWWEAFWGEWVPRVTHGEAYSIVLNGEAIDGVHHGSVTQISHNFVDQRRLALRILAPVVERCKGKYFHIRGTEAHSGASGNEDEQIAKELGAQPDEAGRYARYELWGRVGKGLCHIMHHIGVGSPRYESTAPMTELVDEYTEAGKNQEEPPDVVVRSHRHRHIEVRVPTKLGYGITFCTAGWQLKTPFVYRTASGRVTGPQIGGSLIRQGDEDLYTRHRTWLLSRAKVEIL